MALHSLHESVRKASVGEVSAMTNSLFLIILILIAILVCVIECYDKKVTAYRKAYEEYKNMLQQAQVTCVTTTVPVDTLKAEFVLDKDIAEYLYYSSSGLIKVGTASIPELAMQQLDFKLGTQVADYISYKVEQDPVTTKYIFTGYLAVMPPIER